MNLKNRFWKTIWCVSCPSHYTDWLGLGMIIASFSLGWLIFRLNIINLCTSNMKFIYIAR
jgi:hypothetical protein